MRPGNLPLFGQDLAGVDQQGQYDFAATIVSWAALVAGLGIYAYATREGAKKRDDPEELSRFASEVLVINLASTLLAYLGLAACLLFSSKLREYGPLIWTLSSGIIFTTLGCEWLYAIHEEYRYLALRNICFQILSLILLLTYVKDKSDLLLYAWTTVAGSAGANLINFLRLRKYCTWSLTWRFSWQKHLLPILVLFANSLVNLLYVSADVAQLGVMTSDYYVGLYLVASKVTALLKQLLGAVIVVTVPRLACLYGQKGGEFFRKLARQIADLDFAPAAGAMKLLCLALVFSLLGWFYMAAVLVPARQERAALLAISIASVVNVSLNFLLIPAFKEAGAALATLLADLVTCLACYFLAKKSARLLPSGKKLASSLLDCLYATGSCWNLSVEVDGSRN
ncbi:polysaccharide biosynthesis C-terminal domain-containing protein [Lactobacillus delbrueckii]|uniref:oligosaccharide flippase family protein n=1 Tax=Lactobacillus delbrueckii TaxID=1584 RepID=UPI003A8C611B